MVLETKKEKIWVVRYVEVKRHSRVLYTPIDKLTAMLHKIEKGDILKVFIVEKVVRNGAMLERENEKKRV